MKRIFVVSIFLINAVLCSAQSVCEKLHLLKQQYYGFTPLALTSKQIDAKSADLDKFWSFAENNKTEAITCLKQMILAENKDTYFCFDASDLLLHLDDKFQSLDVVAAGLQKSNLKELQLEEYLHVCFVLGKKGTDISALTEKLISEPHATVFLTEHVITLSSVEASLFLYNTMGTEKAEISLFETLKNGNPTARSNAAMVLNTISTAKGDSLLNLLIKNRELPDSVEKAILKNKKEFAKKLTCKGSINRDEILARLKNYPAAPGETDEEVAGNEEFICSACKALTPGDAEAVRAARDRSTPGLSDESLYDYFALTGILMAIQNK